ncbi:Na+/H+ antiporter NhaC family protein, partial [Candidatus Latescibacterota bacterium]
MESYGILSIVPPVTAITLAFATKQVLPSLFISIWVGASIVNHGNPFAGFAYTIQDYIAGSIAQPWNAAIITYSLTLGGMIGIITKSGGIRAVADSIARKARTARSGQLATLLMGFIIFFDDYANTLLVGNTMRPLTDKLRISREKLAYICDSTAAPISSMALISTWTAYEMGLIKSAFETISVDMNVYKAFLLSIPFRFYSIIALFFVGAVVFFGRDFGPMLRAERRARATGKVIADGSIPLASKELTDMKIKAGIPLRWFNALIPVITVVLMVCAGLYLHGYREIISGDNSELVTAIREHPLSISTVRDCIGHANAAVAMMWAAFTGTLAALVLVVFQRILTLKEAVDAWIEGAKSFIIAVMILVLAWGIGTLCKDMGTASFMVGLLEGRVNPAFIPVMVFIVGCIIAFATGTSYGTAAIVMPIAVPLSYHLSGGNTGGLLFATIGAVFTGAVFGDHCSPISDTTIMSSMACASDHIDHVKTQMPYAVIVAICAVITGFIPAGFAVSPLISLLLGIGMAWCVVRF